MPVPARRLQWGSRGSFQFSNWIQPVRQARVSRPSERLDLRTLRGESGWSRADDNHVAHLRVVDAAIESQAVGQFLNGWTAQHITAVADHHLHLGWFHLEAVEQFLRGAVRVKIDVGERISVAAEKLAQLERLS